MSKTSRRKFTSEFKAKVCLEAIKAIKEQQTIEGLGKKYELHPTQINKWKKDFMNHASVIFEKEGEQNNGNQEELIQSLYAQIGQLKVANDFLKKK